MVAAKVCNCPTCQLERAIAAAPPGVPVPMPKCTGPARKAETERDVFFTIGRMIGVTVCMALLGLWAGVLGFAAYGAFRLLNHWLLGA